MICDDRFWSLVDRSGECWEWLAYRDPKGYGRVTRHGIRKPPILAHRYAWYLAHGSFPDSPDVFVCHTCDNPPCVNPAHLFLGTVADNSRDMASKSRARNGASVYPVPVVQAAVDDYMNGSDSQEEVARRHGVTRAALCDWIRARSRNADAGVEPQGRSRQLRPCGTDAAYARHRRAGETPCDACRAAHAERERKMRG